jgi:hypothetical protein
MPRAPCSGGSGIEVLARPTPPPLLSPAADCDITSAIDWVEMGPPALGMLPRPLAVAGAPASSSPAARRSGPTPVLSSPAARRSGPTPVLSSLAARRSGPTPVSPSKPAAAPEGLSPPTSVVAKISVPRRGGIPPPPDAGGKAGDIPFWQQDEMQPVVCLCYMHRVYVSLSTGPFGHLPCR